MTKEYELIYIVPPDKDQAAVEGLNQETADLIKQHGGTVDNTRTSEVRRLAYEIRGYTEGIYVVVNYRAETQATAELDRVLTLNQQILRHMIIRVDD